MCRNIVCFFNVIFKSWLPVDFFLIFSMSFFRRTLVFSITTRSGFLADCVVFLISFCYFVPSDDKTVVLLMSVRLFGLFRNVMNSVPNSFFFLLLHLLPGTIANIIELNLALFLSLSPRLRNLRTLWQHFHPFAVFVY